MLAASRRVTSCVGGGAARDTVLLRGGGFAAGAGAGFSSAGRWNASGALRASWSTAGAATSRTV